MRFFISTWNNNQKEASNAKIGMIGPNGIRKTLSDWVIVLRKTSTAMMVGMNWAKRETAEICASTANDPE